jgi:low temperature requirement protein LtrA
MTGRSRQEKEVGAMDVSDRGGVPPARIGGEQRVTPLELFFDLVFVFALTQVTGFLSHHLTWIGMLQAAALLTALWGTWAVYSWLTDAVPAEETIPARLLIFCAMAAMFVASLTVPDAFGEYGVVFGVAYFLVFLLQVLLFALATGRYPQQRWAILRLAPGFLGGPALLIVAGFLDGFAQDALWAVRLAIAYGVGVVRGVSGFRIYPRHFAERHGHVGAGATITEAEGSHVTMVSRPQVVAEAILTAVAVATRKEDLRAGR